MSVTNDMDGSEPNNTAHSTDSPILAFFKLTVGLCQCLSISVCFSLLCLTSERFDMVQILL